MAEEPRPRILVVDDDEEIADIVKTCLGGKVLIHTATRLDEAERVFVAHTDWALILMDGCVPGSTINTEPLIKKIRETYTYTGPIVACSTSPDYLDMLVEAGCDHKADKVGYEFAFRIREILGL